MTAAVSIRAATRLPSWLGGRIANAPTPSPLPRELARRKHYDDVGDFLIAHDVTLSDSSFAVALAHLFGDARVTPRNNAL